MENDLLKIKLCNEHSITLLHKSNVKNCNSQIQNGWKYYNIFIDNEKCGQNFNKSRFYGIVSAVRRVHLSPIGYGHYKYYICFGNDTIPIDLNIKYYVCLKHKLFK